MLKSEFVISPAPGGQKLHCMAWYPGEGVPVRGVIQIVHGMVEHIGRYDETASFFADSGFVVVGHDHVGHGRTAADKSELGYIPAKGGSDLLVDCAYAVTKEAKRAYPGLPVVILGHSMGSFVTRRYLTRYGSQVAAAVIMGTGNPSAAKMAFAKAMSALVYAVSGEKKRSKLITFLAFGSYGKRFEEKEQSSWLTADRQMREAHDRDEYSNFLFTNSAYRVLFETIDRAVRKEDIDKIPKELPFLVVSGGEDPVGDFGKGPEKFAKTLMSCGIRDVTLHLYEDDRHEILNEKDREKVRGDILSWIASRITSAGI